MDVFQATGVAVKGRAVLVAGPPGSGKSGLALSLIDRGAILIGDDGVCVQAEGAALIAAPHPRTRGLIEVRNLGLVELPVLDRAPVALLIMFDSAAPRFIDEAETTTIAGIPIPMVRLWPGGDGLALKAELALSRYGLPADCIPVRDN